MIYVCDDFSLVFDFDALSKNATIERISKSNEYKNYIDKGLCLLSFNLLQYAFQKEFGFTIRKEEFFTYGKLGKPYLKNRKDIFFSISHCKNGVAVAVSKNEVGIDIIDFREVSSVLKEKMLNDCEKEIVKNDELEFFRIWSLKEAFAKLQGKSILQNLTKKDNLSNTSISYKDKKYYLSCFGKKEDLIINKISINDFI